MPHPADAARHLAPLRGPRLAGAAVVVGALVAAVAPLPPAALAEARVAHVVTVPPAERGLPRATFLQGDAEGWTVSVESSPLDGPAVPSSTWWTPGGASVPVAPWPYEYAQGAFRAGDRDVRVHPESRLTSHVVHSDEVDEVVVPDDASYLGATEEGVLVQRRATGDVDVLPWESPERPEDVAGAPAGPLRASVFAPRDGRQDAHGVLLLEHGPDGAPAALVLLDTRAHRLWRLAEGDLSIHALGPDAVVWRASTDEGVELRTLPRPHGDDDAPGPEDVTTLRPVGLADRWLSSSRLLPVGDDVLVWPDLGQPGGREAPYALTAVELDGGVRTVRGSVSSVLPAGDGRVRLVTGPADDHRVEVVDVATGAGTEELVIPPVRATASAVALDGRRLLVADDSAVDGSAVRELALEGAGADLSTTGGDVLDVPSAGYLRRCEEHELASGCSPLAAGGGAVAAWGRDSTTVVATDGSTWSLPSSSSEDGGGLRALDGPFLLTQGRWGSRVLRDARSGERLPARGGADLLDGVLSGVSDLDGRVDVRDLRSGRADVLGVRCRPEDDGVSVAGSWIRACGRIRDRTGLSPDVAVGSDAALLGDGFLVRRADDVLEWASLATGAPTTTDALAWQPLGEASRGTPVALTRSGPVPAVAWVGTDGSVRVAALPVAPSPLPARPTGLPTTPPPPAGVRVEPGDGALVVRWASGPESARAHRVRGVAWPAGARAVVRPDGRSADVTGLVNGRAATVEVVAVNAAGESAAATATGTPLSITPPAPRDVRATVDRLTSRVAVTWTWTPSPSSQAASAFTVVVAGVSVRLPATARSASVVVPIAQRATAYVNAETPGGGGESAESSPFSVPGLDRTPPTAAMRPVPAVATSPTTTLGLSGTDDRKLDHYQVRWRRAATGKPLGAWEQHPAWTTLRTGRVDVAGLAEGWTYCFSVRSSDHAGNRSPWSDATCTTRPLDDRRLVPTKGRWTRSTGSAYAAGTVTRGRESLSTLSLDRTRTDAAWLVATTCPTCGKVQVRIGPLVVADVDLRSRTTTHQRLFRLHLDDPHSGTLVVRHHGGGDVLVDGVVLRSY